MIVMLETAERDVTLQQDESDKPAAAVEPEAQPERTAPADPHLSGPLHGERSPAGFAWCAHSRTHSTRKSRCDSSEAGSADRETYQGTETGTTVTHRSSSAVVFS